MTPFMLFAIFFDMFVTIRDSLFVLLEWQLSYSSRRCIWRDRRVLGIQSPFAAHGPICAQ